MDKPLQMRIAKQFTGVALLTLLLTFANFHVVAELSKIYASAPLQAGHTLWIEQLLVWGHGIGLAVVSVTIFFLFSIFYSHRFAGPNKKIVRALNSLSKRDLDMHVRLRSNDYLHEIASALNKASDQWRDSIMQISEAVQALKDCPDATNDPCARAKIEAIEQLLASYNLPESR